MTGASVEVRKNSAATTWYNATLLDLNGNNVRVGFEDNIWPCREVPVSDVRLCPRENSNDDFDPQVDESVEVLVNASDSNPSGWCLGQVKTIKNSFYFISFAGSSKASQDVICEKNGLRRANVEEPVDVSKLVRKLLPVDAELQSWIRSPDSVGCLSHVQNKGRLFVASSTHMEPDATKPPEVLLIGDEHAVDLGEKLLCSIHFKYQRDMNRFHEQRGQLIARLAERRKWNSSQYQESFVVEQALIGKIIGKKGENIKMVREKHNVEIKIPEKSWWEYQETDDTYGDKASTTVTITGDDAESVRKAREDLEYVTITIPIEGDQVGWILGKGFQTIKDVQRKTELHYARFNDAAGALELCGLRQQVEDAKLLISVHCEYLSVYKEMDQEKAAIEQSFDELETVPGAGKWGKGKGSKGESKGRGKGDGAASGKGPKGERTAGGEEAEAEGGGARGRGGRRGGGKGSKGSSESAVTSARGGGDSRREEQRSAKDWPSSGSGKPAGTPGRSGGRKGGGGKWVSRQ